MPRHEWKIVVALFAFMAPAAAQTPKLPGQAAFGAIAEVVHILEADSSTDWSKVDVEALRQHLIDMDDVTLRAAVKQRAVPGGVEMEITGTGRTIGAIQRMVGAHSTMLMGESSYDSKSADLPNGARLTVTARDPSNAKEVAKIRGLGFAGLLTEGDHHARHHLMIARGEGHVHGG